MTDVFLQNTFLKQACKIYEHLFYHLKYIFSWLAGFSLLIL